MANGRRGRPIVRTVRRPTFWEGVNVDSLVATGTQNVIAAVPEATLENVPNPTIVRVRGQFLIGVVSPSAGARAHMTMGLIIVDTQAFSVPVVQAPLGDIGSDWLWWTSISLIADGTGVTPTDDGGLSVFERVEIDNKAMRKFQNNQVLALVLQNNVLNGTMSIRVSGVPRFLFKK